MSVVHLGSGDAAHASVASVVLAAVSVVALTTLAARKLVLGERLPSAALRADGRLSAVGAALAAVTLVGLGATKAFDWWWADPAAALLIGLGAIGLAAVFAGGAEVSDLTE
jgi:divalent metal cation (Fe/Co/Zn/Cd) transporter